MVDLCHLFHAINKNKLEAVKLLEKNGVVMVYGDGDGGEAEFSEAVRCGLLEIVKYYCEKVAKRR